MQRRALGVGLAVVAAAGVFGGGYALGQQAKQEKPEEVILDKLLNGGRTAGAEFESAVHEAAHDPDQAGEAVRASFEWNRAAPGLTLQSVLVEQNAEIIRQNDEQLKLLRKLAAK